MGDNIILWCLEEGHPFKHCFKVTIDKDECIDDLKNLIRPRVDASKFDLCQVSVASDADLGRLKLGDVVSPMETIRDIFPDPPKRCIHVFVKTIGVNRGIKRTASEESTPSEEDTLVSAKIPRILNATNIHQTLFLTTEESDGHVEKPKVLLPNNVANFISLRSLHGMMFVDKTKLIEKIESASPFYRYMLLRPRRFGKSTFLHMLGLYYDIHNAGTFDKLFGPLYIGENRTASCNQHLVLILDLSLIPHQESLGNGFKKYMNGVLQEFLRKYRKELHPPDEMISKRHLGSLSLADVLNLVSRRQYSLFVGVDEYDAPVNSRLNDALSGTEGTHESVAGIESFFQDNLFAVLKHHCGGSGNRSATISKYFLTGVLPAFRSGISPLHATTLITGNLLHDACGFTREEAQVLIDTYLGHLGNVQCRSVARRLTLFYNGYCFKPNNTKEETLYSPYTVINYLEAYKENGTVPVSESPAVHSAYVLNSIPNSGSFSIEDLMVLIHRGNVEFGIVTEFGFPELVNRTSNKRNLVFSLLYYYGMLSYDERKLGEKARFKIPNHVVRAEWMDRVRMSLLGESEAQCASIAFQDLCTDSAFEFHRLLEGTLRRRATRSAFSAGEPVFQAITEVILAGGQVLQVPELCLLADPEKRNQGGTRYVDLFIPVPSQYCAIVLELKSFTLQGLVKGRTGRWKPEPQAQEMEKLARELVTPEEGALLKLPYMRWDKDCCTSVETTVGDVMSQTREQIKEYMDIIALGQMSDGRGMLDERIQVRNGHTTLKGYIVMAIGGQRIVGNQAVDVCAQHSYHMF